MRIRIPSYAKTLAELEAHSHTGGGQGFDCVSLCPGVVLGPSLCKQHTKASVVVVRQMLYGNAQPDFDTAFVDVRDVSEAHVRALVLEQDSSERCCRFLICSSAQMAVSGLEQPLRQLFPDYRIDAVDRLGPLARTLLAIPLLWRAMVNEYQRGLLATHFRFDNTRSISVLGITYRPLDETLRDSVTSMVDAGFVKPRMKPRTEASGV